MRTLLVGFIFLSALCHAEISVDVQPEKKVPFRDASPRELPLSDIFNSGYQTYDVTVDAKSNRLHDEPALARLGIVPDPLRDILPAQELLSQYARTWAKKKSDFNGPNCFHTAIASIFKNWTKHRYMSAQEFACHLRTSFEEIDRPAKWGDLIAFLDTGPIHGFTYLGESRTNPKDQVVFTKNGYGQSEYLFMTYESVHAIYASFGIDKIRYFRPISAAVDPSEDPAAPCAKPFAMGPKAPIAGEIKDAIAESALLRARQH